MCILVTICERSHGIARVVAPVATSSDTKTPMPALDDIPERCTYRRLVLLSCANRTHVLGDHPDRFGPEQLKLACS